MWGITGVQKEAVLAARHALVTVEEIVDELTPVPGEVVLPRFTVDAVAVVPGGPDDYSRTHPSRPVLTVEVAESSLAADRQRKGSLYARAGLSDYWVLNLLDRVLEVYRQPAPDSAAPFGWRYTRSEVVDATARVTPLAAPGSSVSVSQLLP